MGCVHELDEDLVRPWGPISPDQSDPVELRVGAEYRLTRALKLTGAVTRGLTDGAADWGISAGLGLRF